MIEIRYNTQTRVLSAWCADEYAFGYLSRGRPEEAETILDIEIPSTPPLSWRLVKGELVSNLSYTPPPVYVSLHTRVTNLELELAALKGGA